MGVTITTKRQQRVGNLIRKEVEDIIRKEVPGPDIGFFTITSVKVSPDLSKADISVSFLSEAPASRAESFAALENSAGYIKKRLARRVFLKKVPDLRFVLDTRPEFRVEEILREIHGEEDERDNT